MELNMPLLIGKVKLSQIVQINLFLQIINKYKGDFLLSRDIYQVDAKSLMGILSLNLEEVLTLKSKDIISQETIELLRKELVGTGLLLTEN